ncbi:MAG: hypothetical protein KCHDKBKB_01633 [Elusimicrobia bacterium]|nr:hypothetical protein [Elusimicrobiota bacterium]
MIHRIFSNLQSFKSLQFKPGLNILLAKKTPDSTVKQTRNRAGKTSLIELIHFLMGSKSEPDSIFRSDALKTFSFGCDFDLQDKVASIERSGSQPSKIIVNSADTSDWTVQPVLDKKTGTNVISNSNWRLVLGNIWFSLGQSDDEEEATISGPTFRSLFPYFVRRQSSGGFNSPFKHTDPQQLGDQQVDIFYLLGLDWTIAYEWQKVRERERTLREIKKAAAGGTLGKVIGTTAELRTRLAVAEERSKSLTASMQTFRVLPEYHALEKEASEVTSKLGSLADQDTVDRHLLKELNLSISVERSPNSSEVERVYKELGITFPEKVTRRFDEVKLFHDSVVSNRKAYLSEETRSLEARIGERQKTMEVLDKRRAEIMSILTAHGALEQFTQLQTQLVKANTELETLRQQFSVAENIEGQKGELSIERGKLLAQLQQEFREQEHVLRRAIVGFEEISTQLYEQAGSFTLSETLNGPEFGITIPGARSKGITNMQLFCFDMMLMKLCRERKMGPGFLVHDSHLFDGVDDRQIATALSVGAQTAESLKFQYIVTMNSDIFETVKTILPTGFIDQYVMPATLTDESEHGGLFGIRFD